MKIVGFARRDFSDHSFRDELQSSLQEFAPDLWKESQDAWHKFARRVVFHRSDFDNAQGFTWLKERLDKFDQPKERQGNRLFYLATPPTTYTTVIQQLGKAGLVKAGDEKDSDGLHAHHRREAVRVGPGQRPRPERRTQAGLRRGPDLPH